MLQIGWRLPCLQIKSDIHNKTISVSSDVQWPCHCQLYNAHLSQIIILKVCAKICHNNQNICHVRCQVVFTFLAG